MKLDGVAHTSSANSLNPSKASETLSNEVKQQNEIQKNNPKENELGNEKLSKKTIKEAIENTNRKLVSTDRKFEFSINEETNDVIIRVINKETDEVIREIPSEKILDMVAKMMELAGLFIDEKR
ncbi:MAG: flagellar protein FlaG [Clostridia bacterium]|nr:flagellar protein FlaG [Clostridia bacterium]